MDQHADDDHDRGHQVFLEPQRNTDDKRVDRQQRHQQEGVKRPWILSVRVILFVGIAEYDAVDQQQHAETYRRHQQRQRVINQPFELVNPRRAGNEGIRARGKVRR